MVELAPVRDPEAVPYAIADALGITPQGETPVIDTVAEAVAGRRLLIVIDNCEHLLAGAATAIGRVIARSETPRIMATSREDLRVVGEAIVPVSPLALDGGVMSDAVTLFVERAATVRPGFGIFDEPTAEAVVEICETLDGLPLGIELAAARMAAMSAAEVRDRLGDRFRLLTGPEYGPTRQLTLQHAVAWSFDLLDDSERTVMGTASAFAGGFDLTALCAVGGATDDVEVLRLLDSLVRKSLVVAHHGVRPDPVQPVRDHPGVRRGAASSGPAGGPARSARCPLRERGCRALGAMERPRLASDRSTGCTPSWPTCGPPSGGAWTAAR